MALATIVGSFTDKFNLLPVTARSTGAVTLTLPIVRFSLVLCTFTKALGLKPTSEKAAAEKGVAPKYMRDYLAVAGILLLPTNGASAKAIVI